MKKLRYNFTLVLLVAMLICCAAVSSVLAAKAVRIERRASKLTEAVIYASSVSEAFYGAESSRDFKAASDLAEAPEGLHLHTKLGKENERVTLTIIISDGAEEIYSLLCEKYSDKAVW